jgi:PilZ domain
MSDLVSGRPRADYDYMQSHSLADEELSELPLQSGERRKNRRFDMHFPVFLRALGDSWVASETADVSATGALFVIDRPFLLNTPIEYVLTFPPDLTKAPQPLRVRFFGKVLRCERVPDNSKAYGIAVRNTAHRYLSREESASFDAIEQKHLATSNSAATIQPQKSGK